MNLARSRDGLTIHRATCNHARTGVPWKWADDQPKSQVLLWVLRNDLRQCRKCYPLGRTTNV